MTIKTVSWVAPMGEPDDRGNRYITVKFHDGDTAYIGKKDLDAAIEVRGLLEETVDLERDFTLEDTGKKTKDGNTRWKIKAFGDYQPAPYIPGGIPQTSRNLEPIAQAAKENSIARAVALKAAASYLRDSEGSSPGDVLYIAEKFEAWLKISGSASSAYDIPSTETSASSHQAGADPETSGSPTPSDADAAAVASGGPESTSVSAGDSGGQGDEAGSVSGSGEASCPPHQLNLDVAAKAGRYPCRRCGAWVNPRAGYTE